MAVQQGTSVDGATPFLDTSVAWTRTGDPDRMYTATIGEQCWEIRINEFPDEPYLFTLLIDGAAAIDFNDWPSHWHRPTL